MDVPAARRDEVVQIDEGRQKEARQYAVQIARDRLAREDDDQRPREAAHRRVRRVVQHRALRLTPAVLQPVVAENRTSADRARQKRARQKLAPHRARFFPFPVPREGSTKLLCDCKSQRVTVVPLIDSLGARRLRQALAVGSPPS